MSTLRNHQLSVTAPGALISVTRTLEEWGVIAWTLNQNASGEHELQLTFDGDLGGNAAWEPFSKVVFLDGHGTARFIGQHCLRPRRKIARAARRHVVRVPGPHWRLQRRTQVQSWNFIDDPTDVESSQSPSDITTLLLFRGSGSTRVSLQEQLGAILQQAKNAGALIDWDFARFPDVYLAEQRVRMKDDWAVVRELLGWVQHVTIDWRYSVSPQVPTMVFSVSTNGEIASMWPTKVITPADMDDDDVLVTPRDDLLFKTLRVHFVQQHTLDVNGAQRLLRTVTTQTSTASLFDDAFNAPGTLDIQINLRGASISDGEITQAPEQIPPGNLASVMHESFRHLWHELKFQRTTREPDWSWGIGQRVILRGVGDELEGARMMVIGLTHDHTGKVEVQCGPPGRLFGASVQDVTLAPRNGGSGPEDPDEAVEGEEGESTEDRINAYMIIGGVSQLMSIDARPAEEEEEE